MDKLLDSVVLITGIEKRRFGSGFAIGCEQGATWILTCAHVVEDVGGAGKIRVNDKPVEILKCGKRDEVDLAVLRVPELDIPPLKLTAVSLSKAMTCGIAGFTEFAGRQRKGETLEGRLGNHVVLTERGDLRVKKII